jgi:hypothetical protein
MGLITTLALALIPLARRSSSPLTTIPIEVSDELKIARRERDDARADAERWEALALSWRERYERAIAPIVDRELVAQEVATRQIHQLMQAQAQQMHAQMNAQMAMQAQGLGSPYQQDLLGGMNQFPSQWHHCTCVPGRAAAFLRGDSP